MAAISGDDLRDLEGGRVDLGARRLLCARAVALRLAALGDGVTQRGGEVLHFVVLTLLLRTYT